MSKQSWFSRMFGGERLEESGEKALEADVPAIWHVGDVILDLYEVKEVFASGGMGLVYRVHHQGWDIDLAVKSPRPEYFQTEAQKENFIREAETWMNLGLHPNIVGCFYVRTLGGVPCIFAEYVGDGSLADWIRERRLYEEGPLLFKKDMARSLERILDIAIQFALGLHYAHEHGLIHQDVKPANVMISGKLAKVTDFGLARARSMTAEANRTVTNRSILVSVGGMTPAYCSPEQVAGEPLSRKTDIWSWGVSVLEMLVGEVVWPAGPVAAATLENYLHSGRIDLSIPGMPKGIAELLAQCFQKDPDNRPANMAFVAAAVQQIYEEEIGKRWPHYYLPKSARASADDLVSGAFSYDHGAIYRKAVDLNKQTVPLSELRRADLLKADPIDFDPLVPPWQGSRSGKPDSSRASADRLNNEGVTSLDLRGKLEEAERLWKEALKADPKHPEATFNRGILLVRRGEMKCEELLRQLDDCGVVPDPGGVPDPGCDELLPQLDDCGRFLKALVHLERGDVDPAILLLEGIRSSDADFSIPEDPEVLSALRLALSIRHQQLPATSIKIPWPRVSRP